MEKEVVKELIQNDMNEQSLAKELKNLLYDKKYRNKMIEEYSRLRYVLGDKGASVRVANAMRKQIP